MSKTSSNKFGPKHDNSATSATSNVAIWTNWCDDVKTPEFPSNPADFETVNFASNQAQGREGFIALVLKHSKASPNVLDDCETLSNAALNAKYADEYQSWRNMKRRSKDGIRNVHPAFKDFRLFLMSVGAKPKPTYTLDRPDNGNLEYSPANARWASKRGQNRNKSDTVVVSCPRTGRKWFATQLAKKHSVMPDTIRAQRRRGWTDAEIIAGRRLPDAAETDAPSVKPVTTLEPDWHHAMVEHHPDSLAVLSVGAKKMLGRFEDVCFDAGVKANAVLTVVIAHWSEFTSRAASEVGLNEHHLPCIPQARFLAAHPGAAINYWAEKVGCIWKHGRPVLLPVNAETQLEKDHPTPLPPSYLKPPMISQPSKPKEPRPTLQELLAVLNED